MNNQDKFYKWDPNASFTFTGKDFSMLYNILDQITGTPSFQQRVYDARETFSIISLKDLMSKKLSENIGGLVQEVSKEEHDAAIIEAMDKKSE